MKSCVFDGLAVLLLHCSKMQTQFSRTDQQDHECFVFFFPIHKRDLKFLRGQYNVSKADFLQNIIYGSQQGFQFLMIFVIYTICFHWCPDQISSWMLFQGCISQTLQGQNSRQGIITVPKGKHLLNFVCIQINLPLTSSLDCEIWPSNKMSEN